MATKQVGVLWALSALMLSSSLAETLGEFEAAVTRSPPEATPSDRHSGRRHSDRGSHHRRDDDDYNFTTRLVTEVFVGAFQGVKWLAYDWWAGEDDLQYYAHASDDGEYIGPGELATVGSAEVYEEYDLPALHHELGTPYLPYLRFDYRQQYLESDLSAEDLLLEAGYKCGALYGRYTRYEDAADESLDIQQYYGMLRLSDVDDPHPAGIFSGGIGVGGYSIHGQERHGGPALTVPIALYPTDWCGIEFRPAWAHICEKTISDYDVSLSVGHKFAHLRVGYRWLWVQGSGHWLDGPYAGLTFSF
ncbi:MAG: hypothetical protein JXR40_12975 [Pontiellaceae bacterium]|nr:hypothetical protein [Pontiellaceae bacterium]